MILRKFIVLEGIDGAGTSTQLDQLKRRPEASNFLFTAEPSGGETGKFLRRMLSGNFSLAPTTAAYLFAADRNEHIYGRLHSEGQVLESGVEAACSAGKTVVSDRYLFSSLAYQGISCPGNLPYLLNSPFPLPQLLFYFDLDPAAAIRRILKRETKEIYEEEGFLRKVSSQYKASIEKIACREKGMKVIILDATKSVQELAQTVWEEISSLVGEDKDRIHGQGPSSPHKG